MGIRAKYIPKDEGDKIHEPYKSNPTATNMKKKDIIQELKRYGYSRVNIDTDRRKLTAGNRPCSVLFPVAVLLSKKRDNRE